MDQNFIDEITDAMATATMRQLLLDIGYRSGMDINQRPSPISMYVIDSACRMGHLTAIKFLVENGARLKNPPRQYQVTPFHYLDTQTEEQFREIATYLLEHGADLNQENRAGHTMLHVCCYDQKMYRMKFFVEAGADVNRPSSKCMGTPLMHACASANIKMVRYLLCHGASARMRNRRGQTVWHYVRSNGNTRAIVYTLMRYRPRKCQVTYLIPFIDEIKVMMLLCREFKKQQDDLRRIRTFLFF